RLQENQSEDRQPQQTENFGDRERRLHKLPLAYTACIDIGKKNNGAERQNLGGRHANEPHLKKQDVFAYLWDKIRRELRECHTHRRNSGSLDHSKKTPAIQERNKTSVSLLKVDVLSACPGIHAAEFTITHSCSNGHETCNNPDPYEPARASHIPENIGAYDKNSGANHRPGHDHGRIPETQHRFELPLTHRIDVFINALDSRSYQSLRQGP